MQPYAIKKRDSYSFPAFIDKLEKLNLIEYKNGMKGFELARTASQMCKSGGKAIILNEPVPTVLNLFASFWRIELALSLSIKEAAEKTRRFITEKPEITMQYTEPDEYIDISLSDLPIKKHYEGDVSGSLNMACVISEGFNCGIYRIQPLTDGQAVMHCYKGSGLERQLTKDTPVTIALGTSPHLIYAAAATLPAGTDELKLASYLHPAEMLFIDTERYPVPSETQIIIQGMVSSTDKYPEGPFFNYSNSYSQTADFPLMTVESVKMIKGGVYHTTVTGEKPMEPTFLLDAVSAIWSPEEGQQKEE